MPWSLSECIPWMTVGSVESIAIVTLNLCTIFVFLRNRNLRKRNKYLVINLAVLDMFVGGVFFYFPFHWSGALCNLWKMPSIQYGRKTYTAVVILMTFFPIASFTNITIIALERVHAAFFPFRHRVLKKWVYRLIIAVVWVISASVTITYRLLIKFEKTYYYGAYVIVTFSLICPLIICISYTAILIKVRFGVSPQHHGAASRERKLTMTLLIVTVVSLLLYLPHVIWLSARYISKYKIWRSLPLSVAWHLDYALLFLLYVSSLVNPILYAIRMPEFRSALLALFRKRPQQQRQVAPFPLRDM